MNSRLFLISQIIGLVAAAVIIIALVACAPAQNAPGVVLANSDHSTPANAPLAYDGHITRYFDKEAGVVCWLFVGSGPGMSISCLPIRDTFLGNQ